MPLRDCRSACTLEPGNRILADDQGGGDEDQTPQFQ